MSNRVHALKPDTDRNAAKADASSVTYEIHDGVRVVATGPRSEVMKAAKRLPLGTTCGRPDASPTFVLTDKGWLFTG